MIEFIHIDDTTTKLDLSKYDDGMTHRLSTSWDVELSASRSILVKENCQSSDFLRTYFKFFNPTKSFCSHLLFMENDSKQFILTDVALNINPSLKDLVKITKNAIKFWRGLDITPPDQPIHINFLSNSGHLELGNPTSCNCQLLKDYFEQTEPTNYYTTWQLDTCLYDKSRMKKNQGSLFNTPDIIVVPNLDTGNAIYKALLYQYNCYGFVIGGDMPAVLNSRSDLDKNEKAIKILLQAMSIL